jgi:ureidoacrylate peracid hydrolase
MSGGDSYADPFALAEWDLIPGRTALVVIDPQNDFLHEDGWYATNGIDISHMQRIIEPTKELVKVARESKIPLVWTRHGTRGDVDAGPFFKLRPFLMEGGLRQGTWGYEVLDGLGAENDDWYVDKTRLSAFYGSNLEVILRGLHAETVVFAGVLTNQCVAATSKDAMYRDFKDIVVEECTGTTLPHLHEPALEMVSVGWGRVMDLDTAMSQIKRMHNVMP